MKNELQKMNIAGVVESFTETTYSIFSDEDETIFEREDEPSLFADFIINTQGNIERQNITMPQSGDAITTDYIYENCLKIEEEWHYPDGRIDKTVFQYDENDLPVIEISTRNGQEIVKTSHFYNENSQLVETATLYTNGTHVRRFFKYDDRGNKVEEREIEKTEFTSEERTVYTYDDNNEIVENIDYDAEGNVLMTTRYKYADYDEHGNWTTKTELMDDVPIRVVVRSFQYRG